MLLGPGQAFALARYLRTTGILAGKELLSGFFSSFLDITPHSLHLSLRFWHNLPPTEQCLPKLSSPIFTLLFFWSEPPVKVRYLPLDAARSIICLVRQFRGFVKAHENCTNDDSRQNDWNLFSFHPPSLNSGNFQLGIIIMRICQKKAMCNNKRRDIRNFCKARLH